MSGATDRSVHLGVVAMLVYSFLNASQIILATVLHDNGWPNWHIMAAAFTICLVPMSLACYLSDTPAPSWDQVKWMVIRTLFVPLGFVCAATAVHISGSPGDVQALTSINVVAAAAVGCLVLNEHLRWIHSIALLSSIVGALLISRPSFLFGGNSSSASLLTGHALALLAGGARAMALICARKCGAASALHMSLALNIIAGVVFSILPFTPVFELRPLDICWQQPWALLGWLAALVFSNVFGLLGGSLGSMLCPAAVSATVFTGSGMAFGYAAQVLIFGKAPDAVTLLGSALMLLAVLIMTIFRVRSPSAPDDVADHRSEPEPKPELPNCQSAAAEDDDDSLLSFAASEFAEFEAHKSIVRDDSLRLRPSGRRVVEPYVFGNAVTTVASVVADAGASA